MDKIFITHKILFCKLYFMKVGIVWLPNVWKSTLFNALTKSYAADAANFPFCTIEPNVWIVNVNDPRLEKIAKAVNAKKIIPATCEFTDIAGIVKWASKWEWLWNKFLANIRQTDAILQVVRAFKDKNINHVSGKVDPKDDVEVINSELILADLETVESKMKSIEKKARMDKQVAKTYEIYKKVKEHLENGGLVYTMDLSDEEKKVIRDLHLLTNKPFVYAVNVSEDQLDMTEDELRDLIWIHDKKIPVVAVCAKLEADMIDFDENERKEFLEEMWIKSTWVDNLIKTAYDALWLQYFFTAGEKEVRAWTIKKWSTAPEAAGVIHTDFQKWFIKADVVNRKDLVEYGGWAKAREAGKVRLEWKDYIVQDGDVMLFKFNV